MSHKYKFVFIAVPKTGTTSICDALKDLAEEPFFIHHADSPIRKHTSASELKSHFEENGWEWEDYFKFGFVRNPWDRMLSLYLFIVKSSKKNKEREEREFVKWWIERCRDYVKEYPTFRDYIKNKNHDYSMLDMLTIAGERIDYIGKFERIQEDFNIVCDSIGIPQRKLSVLNVTNHEGYQKYYDEESRDKIQSQLGVDIESFGYEF